MSTKEILKHLADLLNEGSRLPKAEENWCGADIAIVRKRPRKTDKGFYPDPLYVETKYALELSWFLEQLRDAFYAENLLDGCSKIEFFGRLANAAIRAKKHSPDLSAAELCSSVLKEAQKMFEELKSGTFEILLVSFHGEIADDLKGHGK